MRIVILILLIFYKMKNPVKRTKTFQFIKIHTKLQLVENYCVLGSIKQIDLLKPIMEFRCLVLFDYV